MDVEEKMTDQVFMSPNNGQLVVGIPLFRSQYFDEQTVTVTGLESFVTTLCSDVPLAYILDCGEFAQVVSAKWVDEKLINLGEL
jgi:hypothetical protein